MLRGFTDSTGLEWRVWEVFPSQASLVSDRKAFARSSLKETPFANGWLCFESGRQKRRLAPIPPKWEFRDPRELEELCNQAAPVAIRQRTGAPQTSPDA